MADIRRGAKTASIADRTAKDRTGEQEGRVWLTDVMSSRGESYRGQYTDTPEVAAVLATRIKSRPVRKHLTTVRGVRVFEGPPQIKGRNCKGLGSFLACGLTR